MTNRTAITALIGAFILALILMFGYSVNSYSELRRNDMQVLEDSKRYTDTRIIEKQANMVAAISDVTKTTKLLTRIICLSQFDKNECEQELGPLYKEN
ncbi:hypothetical protein [Pseudomonas sp. FW305-70]|uniref:hypothetical protein n=1 Tax=Pseudomonas sp. FW305-70 TaxID=2751342 RepID=UPI000C87FFD4|nr:hypothetical protein [Pseudomonas sp. FW305-70]PMZ76954.1 hypothetical protein C1X65_08210 [Pseudomonas sp. FW305-70]